MAISFNNTEKVNQAMAEATRIRQYLGVQMKLNVLDHLLELKLISDRDYTDQIKSIGENIGVITPKK